MTRSAAEAGQQRLGDLDGVQRRPLAEVVAGEEKDQPVLGRRVPSDPSDQRGVDAGAGERRGDVDDAHPAGGAQQGDGLLGGQIPAELAR